MKIVPAKNDQPENKETKSNFKTETSVFDTSVSLKPSETVPAQTNSAFAKILEETRKNSNEKESSKTAKSDSSENGSKTSKSESDEKISRSADEKKDLEEKNNQNNNGDSQTHDDENQAPLIALAALQFQVNAGSEHSAPAARSILHVTDLERIVSTVRTETFQNQKQITIALKNSILEGLQIKLTITENGKLKAEFLALNEQIKKQLTLRKKELSEILRNRSALFSEVEISSQN